MQCAAGKPESQEQQQGTNAETALISCIACRLSRAIGQNTQVSHSEGTGTSDSFTAFCCLSGH